VTAALSVLLGREGDRPLVIKPVQTGCLKKGDSLLVPDVACVQAFGGEACALHCYEPPCSPHLAADLAGEKLHCQDLACEVREKALDRTVLVEGAGGLYVPLNETEDMLDLMKANKKLLTGGIKICEYTPGFVHAKSFVSDDKVATIGTVNLDYRSLFLHFENNSFFYRSSIIAAIKDDFIATQAKCKEIKPYDMKHYSRRWVVDGVLRIFAPLC